MRPDLPDVICDTSVIQYLHQLELLHILPALAVSILVPQAVLEELALRREAGVITPATSWRASDHGWSAVT